MQQINSNSFKEENSLEFYLKIPFLSRRKHISLVHKISQLLVYRERIAACYEVHRKYTYVICGKTYIFLMLTLVVHKVTTGLKG
jgi:hypothetical protein